MNPYMFIIILSSSFTKHQTSSQTPSKNNSAEKISSTHIDYTERNSSKPQKWYNLSVGFNPQRVNINSIFHQVHNNFFLKLFHIRISKENNGSNHFDYTLTNYTNPLSRNHLTWPNFRLLRTLLINLHIFNIILSPSFIKYQPSSYTPSKKNSPEKISSNHSDNAYRNYSKSSILKST